MLDPHSNWLLPRQASSFQLTRVEVVEHSPGLVAVHLAPHVVLENTGALVRKTPGEVKTLVASGVYIEIIPAKLLRSRKL